jgi:hypothetical protein
MTSSEENGCPKVVSNHMLLSIAPEPDSYVSPIYLQLAPTSKFICSIWKYENHNQVIFQCTQATNYKA